MITQQDIDKIYTWIGYCSDATVMQAFGNLLKSTKQYEEALEDVDKQFSQYEKEKGERYQACSIYLDIRKVRQALGTYKPMQPDLFEEESLNTYRGIIYSGEVPDMVSIKVQKEMFTEGKVKMDSTVFIKVIE